jgi:hypothetical protein
MKEKLSILHKISHLIYLIYILYLSILSLCCGLAVVALLVEVLVGWEPVLALPLRDPLTAPVRPPLLRYPHLQRLLLLLSLRPQLFVLSASNGSFFFSWDGFDSLVELLYVW